MEKTKGEEIVNLGRSLLVPSVIELSKKPITSLPSRYFRVSDNHLDINTSIVFQPSTSSVPVIDLQKLLLQDEYLDSQELLKLHSACKHWGFFQVINHGVSTSLLDSFKAEVVKLFNLPTDVKQKLWQKPDNHEGFGQLFVVSEEQKLDWSDMFYVTTLPPKLRRTQLFDNLPQPLRDVMEAYITAAKKLALTLLHQMGKALGMNKTETEDLFSEGLQSIRMNYYPPCPEPHKVIGLSPHSDADALTIVFQLNDTPGLEIRKDGNWVPVMPLETALVVNVGDSMEIVSNGTYRSVEHRATVNSTQERISVATFYSPYLDTELGPAKSIIGPENPPIFRRELTELYYKGFFARKLNGKSYIQEMRLDFDQGESDASKV